MFGIYENNLNDSSDGFSDAGDEDLTFETTKKELDSYLLRPKMKSVTEFYTKLRPINSAQKTGRRPGPSSGPKPAGRPGPLSARPAVGPFWPGRAECQHYYFSE